MRQSIHLLFFFVYKVKKIVCDIIICWKDFLGYLKTRYFVCVRDKQLVYDLIRFFSMVKLSHVCLLAYPNHRRCIKCVIYNWPGLDLLFFVCERFSFVFSFYQKKGTRFTFPMILSIFQRTSINRSFVCFEIILVAFCLLEKGYGKMTKFLCIHFVMHHQDNWHIYHLRSRKYTSNQVAQDFPSLLLVFQLTHIGNLLLLLSRSRSPESIDQFVLIRNISFNNIIKINTLILVRKRV